MKKDFECSTSPKSPVEIAHHCVAATLALQKERGKALLTMGEHHDKLPHQITEACAIKEIAESGLPTTFFIELPHDRLHVMLLDRGYAEEDAKALYDHISKNDPKGHITAKAMIGGNLPSLKGGFFIDYEAQVALQAALVNDANIACVDASRSYPKDHILNYDEPITDSIANEIGARRGVGEEMGPDDMLLRNTIMARLIDTSLQDGHIGVLMTGSAHVFGLNEPEDKQHNIQTPYADSLAKQFENMDIPSVMLYLPPIPYLPDDYEAIDGRQDIFMSPPHIKEPEDITNKDIRALFVDNGLDPQTYDPRYFHDQYRVEFNNALKEAEDALGIKGPSRTPPLRAVMPNLKVTPYCPTN